MSSREIISFVVVLMLAGGITAILTPFVKKLAERLGAVDMPSARRVNTYPLPRMGGLAIAAGFFVAVLALVRPLDSELVGILLGAVAIVLVGAVDDVVSLKPIVKLVLQIVAATIPVLFGLRIEFFSNIFFIGEQPFISLGALAAPLTVCWIVGVCNAVNLIDGLDGLACGVSAIASLSIFFIVLQIGDPVTAMMVAALTGACLGFLPFNTNPSKIIMGDSGALFLGYILATLSVVGMFKWYTLISFAVPLLIVGLPLFEFVFSFLRRLFTGKNPFKADKGHIHHRLLDLGMNQKQAVAVLYVVSAMLGLMAIVLTARDEIRAMLVLILAAAAAWLGIWLFGVAKRRKARKQARKGENYEEN